MKAEVEEATETVSYTFTQDEFRLIRQLLHPDKNPHPKASKAFQIFSAKAKVEKR